MRFYIFKRYNFHMTRNNLYAPLTPQTSSIQKNFVYFVIQFELSAFKWLWYKFIFLRYCIRYMRLLFLSSMLLKFFLFPVHYQIHLSKEVQAILAPEMNAWFLATNSQRNIRAIQILAENEFFLFSPWKLLIRRPFRNNPAIDLSWGLGVRLHCVIL